MKRPVPITDLLTTLFRGKPVEQRLQEGKIWLVWDAAVGQQIAAKARPVSFRDGILAVSVVSAPWMQQLTFLKTGMIEKLNERIGRDLIRDIYLKAGMAQPLSPQPEPGKKPRRQLTEEETCRIGEQTATISDPELREAFARVLARDLETKSRCACQILSPSSPLQKPE
jgi:predicted nucleic acid-binding Zn ribbon protein